MRFINLTKDHVVVVYNPRLSSAEVHVVNSGVARVESQLLRYEPVVDENSGEPIQLIAFVDDITYGLPEPEEGTIYIVSKAVREANRDRTDLASPDVTSVEAGFEGGKLRSVPGLVVNARR